MNGLGRIGWLLPVLFFLACNKSNQLNTRLIKGESWHIYDATLSEVSIEQTTFIAINSSSFAADEEYGEGTWNHTDGSKVPFTWRFYLGGDQFEMWNKEILDETSKASLQCYYWSGIYSVESNSTNEFEISSAKTNGYSGKEIRLKMKKK